MTETDPTTTPTTTTAPPKAPEPAALVEPAEPAKSPVLTGDRTHVWMLNADLSDEAWACPLAYAPTALTKGWEYAEDPTAVHETDADVIAELADLVAETAPEVDTQTGFDPADHNVDEVNKHLAQYADTAPGEVNRVLNLERAGKDRSGVHDPRPVATEGVESTTSGN